MNTQTATNTDTLPPKVDRAQARTQDRVYRTALAQADFLKLEAQAMARNLKAFSFTKHIVTLYLHKKMVVIADLPEPLRTQVAEVVSKQP